MDRDYFLNPGLQLEQSSQAPWKLMTAMPEMNLLPEQPSTGGIWEKSNQYSQFESALSSMVSSPVSGSMVSNDIVAVRELIGKLGGGSMSTPPPPYSSNNSPLNSSPQKLMPPRVQNSMPINPEFPLLAADPGFAERAAKFSCFGSRSFNGRSNQLGLNSNNYDVSIGSMVSPVKFHRVSSSPALKIERSSVGFEENKNSDEKTNVKLNRLSSSATNSNEESSVSEQIPSKDLNSRKRKGGPVKGNGSTTKKEEETVDESKKLKKTEEENGGKTEENKKPAEPPKDYIHVRARRGQATDSHSLAERVRREKISERMKLLQNLVPNCNKVTGKALMLDEIINYVQSLQRQVEFLSMKLATVNPSLDFDTNDHISQNVCQPNGNLSLQTSTFYQQNPQVIFNGSAPMTQSVHEFTEPFPQFPGFGQDDLQSIVRMGFGENIDLDASFFHTTPDQPSDMKIEL